MEPLSHKWFLQLTRQSGAPLGSPDGAMTLLQGNTEAAKFVVKDTVWQGLQCCICWQSPLYTKAKDHGTERCPLLLSMNEMRKGANLVPVSLSRLGLVATTERLPVKVEDLEKKAKKRDKEMRDTIKALQTRMSLMEDFTGINADPPPVALERRRKNSKKEKVKERHGGHSDVRADPVQSGSGRQRGKRRQTDPPPSSSNSNVPSSISAWDE